MADQFLTITEMEEVFRMAKWARKNGAVRFSVNGFNIEFAHGVKGEAGEMMDSADLPDNPPAPPDAAHSAPPNLQYLLERAAIGDREHLQELGEAVRGNSSKAPPAIRSEADDPDIFAQTSDAWANQTRLPRR